jgi:hypothetical protein
MRVNAAIVAMQLDMDHARLDSAQRVVVSARRRTRHTPHKCKNRHCRRFVRHAGARCDYCAPDHTLVNVDALDVEPIPFLVVSPRREFVK